MNRVKRFFKRFAHQAGNMTKQVVGVMVGVIVLGATVPALWGQFQATDTDIQALTQTDTATTTLQAFWPIALLVIGLGIAVGVIVYALRKFKLA